jgi:uncharacterized protein (TIGR02391 family)
MPEENDVLTLKFDPHTIEHLGIKMYSQLPQALAELVANAYDADAENVVIELYDNDPSNKKIVVRDDGIGMSFDDVRDKFLVIGRKRRDSDAARQTTKRRAITGRKGLGKLALFGIGNNITIETSVVGEAQGTNFILNWADILGEGSGKYAPQTARAIKMDANEHGTTITLSELTRASNFDLEGTAIALSKMFNCIDGNFKVLLGKNEDVANQIELTRELKYNGMVHEFQWNIATDIIPCIESDYEHKNEIKGMVVSSPEGKVMRQDLRGITLYANGRLANTAGFFGISETPHAFSYLSGWIDANFLDELTTADVIATDRQSISWDLPETEALQKFLQKIVNYVVKKWEEGRREKKKRATTESTGIDVDKWKRTLPNDINNKVDAIVKSVVDNPEIETGQSNEIIKKLFDIVPEYAPYYWRCLHVQIQKVSEAPYKDKNYYSALLESCKEYVAAVRTKAKTKTPEATLPFEDRSLMGKAFGKDNTKALKVLLNVKQSDGTDFPAATIDSLEDAQMLLSQGVITGYRNPIAHAVCKELSDIGIITDQDCLDALSLLSLLFQRLDKAEKTPKYTN